MKPKRPGIDIEFTPQHFVLNCIAMLNMLPIEGRARAIAMRHLSNLSFECYGWSNERFVDEIMTCHKVLSDYNSKITWWIEEGQFNFDYNVYPPLS